MPRVAYTITTSRTASITLPVHWRRAGRVVQVIAGTLLLGIAYLIGHNHATLVASGAQATGTIVGFKPEQIWSARHDFTWTANLPIVEYRVAGRAVRFEDWLGRPTEALGATVPVLY